MEKKLLLAESQALQSQFQSTVAEKDRQIAELQRVRHEMESRGPGSTGGNYPIKVINRDLLKTWLRL